MKRRRIAVLAAASAMALTGAFASQAAADYHLIKISEVHSGVAVNGDYVELQMYADGQNNVATHHLRLFDGTGSVLGDYAVPTSLANGQSQRTFTIGNTPDFDFNYGGVSVGASGAACWNEKGIPPPLGGVDCVSWGVYTPGLEALSSPAGTPALGLLPGQSLNRRIDLGCTTLLESFDDTDNSSRDFRIGAPTKRSNAVAPTEKPCKKPAKKCKKKKGGKKSADAAGKKKKKCKKKKKKKN
jgi:hypothetical protein